MKAYKHLIEYALDTKHTISVWDGEEWAVKRSTDSKEIIEAIESVDEAQIRIRNDEHNQVAWALVSAFGLADDETVMDHSDNEFMNGWSNQYELTQ